MKITDFFQKGYYINLDRRTDRNELFIEEMKSHNLDTFFERVSALDGINELDMMKRHHYCAASYYKLFKKIYEEGHECVLIFEDDAAFYKHYDTPTIELIENSLDDLKDFDWNLIYFGGCPLFEMKSVSKNLSKIEWVLGLHAVGYKRKTIKYVLDNYKPFEDGAIDGWYGNSPQLNKYITSIPLIYQRPVTSDLDAHGHISSENDYINCYSRVEKK
jgi:GR25 family glycosyltransferase involved in LPS biosynthesis